MSKSGKLKRKAGGIPGRADGRIPPWAVGLLAGAFLVSGIFLWSEGKHPVGSAAIAAAVAANKANEPGPGANLDSRSSADGSSAFAPTVPNKSGGSFLCTDQYCTRYMVGSRGKGEVNTGCNHLGFRCVKDS